MGGEGVVYTKQTTGESKQLTTPKRALASATTF